MEFKEAVKSVFSKYAVFSGRATRSEYWYFYLFSVLVQVGIYVVFGLLGLIFGGIDGMGASYNIANGASTLFGLAILVPSLAVMVRRLHDTSRSAWNLLWVLLPLIGVIVLLVFLIMPSKEENQYGPRVD